MQAVDPGIYASLNPVIFNVLPGELSSPRVTSSGIVPSKLCRSLATSENHSQFDGEWMELLSLAN